MTDLFFKAFYYGIILATIVAWVGMTLIVFWEMEEWRKRK